MKKQMLTLGDLFSDTQPTQPGKVHYLQVTSLLKVVGPHFKAPTGEVPTIHSVKLVLSVRKRLRSKSMNDRHFISWSQQSSCAFPILNASMQDPDLASGDSETDLLRILCRSPPQPSSWSLFSEAAFHRSLPEEAQHRVPA